MAEHSMCQPGRPWSYVSTRRCIPYLAPGGVPRRLPCLGLLPQGEVGGVLLAGQFGPKRALAVFDEGEVVGGVGLQLGVVVVGVGVEGRRIEVD